jgi:hypothetical protein
VDPRLLKYRKSDGTMKLKLDKALYGCIQSSFLWQQELTKVLIKMGFRISAY